MPQNARDVAVTALVQWEREQTYSNIMLDNLLQAAALSPADAALTTRLVYGVIERLLTVDWVLQKNSRRPIKSCHPTVRAVLRIGTYQLLFMEKIPVSAAVNEAVGQVKRMKQIYAAGFVNAVLRSVVQNGTRLLASLTTDLKGDSVRYSMPIELLTIWKTAYGAQTAAALAACANDAPPAVIRVNTLKTTVADFKTRLDRHHISYASIAGLPHALVIDNAAALRAQSAWESLYYFQDTASQWACKALGVRPGDCVADVCAAPGGKSFTCAMDMNNEGEVVSSDIYDEKVAVLTRRAAQYGISVVKAVRRDASAPCATEDAGRFDRVICDVPCSGFGVIRRKPEIRYKSLDEFADLPALQYTILCQAANMVKAGGVLQYSTCTLRPEENEQIVSRFLHEHPEFSPRELPLAPLFEAAGLPPSHQLTLMPHIHHTDGFFIASFRKEETV